MFDVITIGGATTDTFVQVDRAKIINVETKTTKDSYLCFDYGEKLEADRLAYDIGGGAANTAVNFANMGFNTGIVVKIGEDLNSKAVLKRLNDKNIDTSMLLRTDEDKTGFSVILTSYEGDRTVVMHRGTNNLISLDDIDWQKIKQSKWIYFASLSGASNQILDKMALFAEENGINMAFNPGSTQIRRGIEDLKKILETAEILIMNRSEASAVTGVPNYPPDDHGMTDENLIEMITKLKSYNPKIVVITEGKKGVYAYDGETLYYTKPFPAQVKSTLGAGDSFASTFTGTIIKYGFNEIERALKYASVNSASVVSTFGAQQGLKNFTEIEESLNQKPDFQIEKKYLSRIN